MPGAGFVVQKNGVTVDYGGHFQALLLRSSCVGMRFA
jgi:hypothetical protein